MLCEALTLDLPLERRLQRLRACHRGLRQPSGAGGSFRVYSSQRACMTTFTFPSEESEFLGYKSKSQTVALKPVSSPLPPPSLQGCIRLLERPQSLANLELDQDSPSFPFQPAFPARFPQFPSPAQLPSDIEVMFGQSLSPSSSCWTLPCSRGSKPRQRAGALPLLRQVCPPPGGLPG